MEFNQILELIDNVSASELTAFTYETADLPRSVVRFPTAQYLSLPVLLPQFFLSLSLPFHLLKPVPQDLCPPPVLYSLPCGLFPRRR